MKPDTREIINEELWRSVVWLAIGLFGWSLILTSTDVLAASALTALGLPLLTAAVLAALMVGIRLATGLELKAKTEGSQLLWLIVGSVLGGFVVLYDVLVNGRDPPIILGYAVAVGLGVLIWRVARRQQSTV
ncbi:hypothetical protein [Haloarcula sp. 1CSR25-25]|jgi:hypothetical protein|uniref:hypothetical protein n=1 Tax=Haloarcula sp. 1CSR25-25 TaxID=2862545 RepID=UPI0028952F62|nr:hypothetical protein [Haloarcula sp. 1CSR25-25]MDT3437440.1 hypothetical protein [Haloarcula sp. 1CSR25-25]